jgi:hypothetical protein
MEWAEQGLLEMPYSIILFSPVSKEDWSAFHRDECGAMARDYHCEWLTFPPPSKSEGNLQVGKA